MSKRGEAYSRVVDAGLILCGSFGLDFPEALQVQTGDVIEQATQHAEAVAQVFEGLVLESVKPGLSHALSGYSSLVVLRDEDPAELAKLDGVSKTTAEKLVGLLNPAPPSPVYFEEPVEDDIES